MWALSCRFEDLGGGRTKLGVGEVELGVLLKENLEEENCALTSGVEGKDTFTLGRERVGEDGSSWLSSTARRFVPCGGEGEGDE
jgi:hypothetical protein